MNKKYISLREVGRRLDVPPSTIVYYKDKFSKYIPSEGGGTKRRRYPVEVLEIFRRIREMFNNNWSTEQIERELALKFSMLVGGAADQDNDQLYNKGAESFAHDIGAVLAKMSEALEDQSLFRSEIRSLRDEVAELRKERKASEEMYQRKVDSLEEQIREMHKRANFKPGAADLDFPSNEFLSSPLVICSDGEYLGVQGKGRKHFTLKDFVHLIERKVSDLMSVETSWKAQGENWVLVVRTSDTRKDKNQDIVLVSKKTVTPSNNTVTEIVRLNIDGNDAPDALLLTLFRQLKSVFNS